MTRRAPENRLTGNPRRISPRRALLRELQDTAAEAESARVARRRPVIRLPKAAVHRRSRRRVSFLAECDNSSWVSAASTAVFFSLGCGYDQTLDASDSRQRLSADSSRAAIIR